MAIKLLPLFTGCLKVAFFILPGITLQACKNDETEIKRVTKNKEEPVETVSGLTVLYNDSGHVKAKVVAPLMYRYAGANMRTILPRGVQIYFYDQEQNVISTLTARHAESSERSKTMEARNDVVVRNSKGEQLNTERLVWDERTGKFSSDAFVKITTASEVIMGEGFEANQDFTKYRILHPRGNITVNKEDSV